MLSAPLTWDHDKDCTPRPQPFQESASVVLLGPRQVGKTTLAFALQQHLPGVYLDLENRTDLLKVQDIEAFHQANREHLIILDEVQRVPEIFAAIRGLIDAERRRGHRYGLFLFLGPATLELLQQSSESLAGRLTLAELFPIDGLEFQPHGDAADSLNRLWLRGGFPESVLAADDAISLRWRQNFIRTYLERDVPTLGPRVPATTLERLWIMLAHSQGSPLNASTLASALDVSSVSVARYVDLLTHLLLLRRLPPFVGNVRKRLVKSPRVYVRDSGITHALLNIGSFNELLGHPVAGKSWEAFVIENLLAVVPRRAQASYYRTAGGAEIDLVLDFPAEPGTRYAIEIKRSPSASLSRGFHEACSDISPSHRFVVHAQTDAFTLPGGIEVLGLREMMARLQST